MSLLRRLGIAVLLVLALGYGGAVAYMYVNQRALQYAPDGVVVALAETALDGAQDIVVPSGEGAVHGWYQAPRPGLPVILYYKGNAGSFSEEHERFEQFVSAGYGFVAFDYRGFPASPGSISQQAILEDALSVYDWAEVQGFPLVVWGRSLGTGPATYVSSQRAPLALLLETPFLSAVTVAGERYPYLPVAWVMQDQFPVNQWIVDVRAPVLIAHGTGDSVIDVSNGERLYALVPNKDELWIEPGADHSDLWSLGIWRHAEAFFQRAMTP